MVVRTSFLHKYSRRRDACITIKESQAGRLHYNKGEEKRIPVHAVMRSGCLKHVFSMSKALLSAPSPLGRGLG